MLPILSTPSAPIKLAAKPRPLAVQRVVDIQEPLSGEWQRAKVNEKPSERHTLEGELVLDMAAVSSYLAAAGESTETVSGSLISLYA